MFELEGFDSNYLHEVSKDLLAYTTFTDRSGVPLVSTRVR